MSHPRSQPPAAAESSDPSLDGGDVSDPTDAEGFAEFVALLEPATPATGGLERLLGAASPHGRLWRFAEAVSDLLDVDRATAQRLLDAASTLAAYEEGPFPGVRLHHVSGGPAVAGAITGFVRIEGGSGFPEHAHLGDEAVLVIQGSMHDLASGVISRPGDLVRAGAGTLHEVVARPGPDLVYLAVLFKGLRIGDAEMLADDPRL